MGVNVCKMKKIRELILVNNTSILVHQPALHHGDKMPVD
jgi:hypothetical protein